ncbi:brachyury protein-like [Acanthaster planci]|uniref:Brachyury protein-like n=1 Tax=Acanthaster planci TaxID=133434 RepID=A0A8B7YJB3_ACAPL|nr:brachyury protein-like [Acanthaster planci]
MRLLLGADYMLTGHPAPVRDSPDKDAGPLSGRHGSAASVMETNEGGLLLDEPISQCVDGIQVTLENSRLWKMFDKCGTEMIVNRIGRRMFPCIVTAIRGMDATAMYRVQMELDASDRRRYKFINGKWLPVGKADPETSNQPFEHPDSPNLGAFWMQDRVSFAKLKITNNKEGGGDNTVLHSMHKYTPCIIISKLRRWPANVRGIGAPCSDPNLPTDGSVTKHRELASLPPVGGRPARFEFRETSFIAVTAYHSEQITQLKIQNNPFAKAFRDADVTAILQGAFMLSEPNELHFPSMSSGGLMPSMHPGCHTLPMDWQTTSSPCRNQLDPNMAGYGTSLDDALYWRGGHVRVPEFSDSPWSFDNVAALHPSGTHPHDTDSSVRAINRRQGLLPYRSHPTMAFDAVGRTPMTSSGLSKRHRHSIGALQDALQVPKVNRTLSHPEIKFEPTASEPLALPTTNAAFEFSEFRQTLSEGTYHPLRRVSSAAVSRSIKRHSLPYFSQKKAATIPRYRSAEDTFGKSLDLHGHVPRRHSIVEGSPLFRASTGNLRGKLEAEPTVQVSGDFLLSPSNVSGVAASRADHISGSFPAVTTDAVSAGASSSTYAPTCLTRPQREKKNTYKTKKQINEQDSLQPDVNPGPRNLELTNP